MVILDTSAHLNSIDSKRGKPFWESLKYHTISVILSYSYRHTKDVHLITCSDTAKRYLLRDPKEAATVLRKITCGGGLNLKTALKEALKIHLCQPITGYRTRTRTLIQILSSFKTEDIKGINKMLKTADRFLYRFGELTCVLNCVKTDIIAQKNFLKIVEVWRQSVPIEDRKLRLIALKTSQ